mgnify:FL=1
MFKGIKNWIEIAKTVSEVLAEKKLQEKAGNAVDPEAIKSIVTEKINPAPVVAVEEVAQELPKVEQKREPVMSPKGDPKVFELQKQLIEIGRAHV